MILGTAILGNFQPASLSEGAIRAGLVGFLLAHDLRCGLIDVRSPAEQEQAFFDIQAQYPDGWHYETECVGRFFGVWSNHSPTEVRFVETSEVLRAEAGDVLLIDNLEVKHRMPRSAGSGRWFARMWHLDLVWKGEND